VVAAGRGALLQEGIDVAVILNALRALRGNPAVEVELSADTEKMLRRFAAEHDELRDTIGLLRDAADQLDAGAPFGRAPGANAPARLPHRPDPAARTRRGNPALPRAGASAR
jgi:hypothetical protein